MPSATPFHDRVDLAVDRARTGDPVRALRSVAALLEEHPDATPERAACLMAQIHALRSAGRFAESMDAALELVAVGDRIAEPGWSAIGHAWRAVPTIAQEVKRDTFEHLVEAEAALDLTTDEGLLATASAWLSLAYLAARLYERAEVHTRRATELNLDHFGNPWPRSVSLFNLAEIYLRWAEELNLVRDPADTARVEELRSCAAGYAHQSLDADAEDGGGAPYHVRQYARLTLGTAICRTEPARATTLLEDSLAAFEAAHFHDERASAWAHLTLAHHRLGRAEEASRSAENALGSLTDDSLAATSVLVRWVHLHLAHLRGDHTATVGLDLAREVARDRWRQRERDLGAVGIALEGRRQRDAYDDAVRASMEDPLTGAANRRALRLRLDDLDAEGVPVVLAVLDVDAFKQVNDQHGHEAGDAVLRGLVERLRPLAGDTDLVVRVGGDEFWLVRTDPEEAGVEPVRAALAAALAPGWSAAVPGATVSYGLAATAEGLALGELDGVADRRLYDAKDRLRADGRDVRSHRPVVDRRGPATSRASTDGRGGRPSGG